MATTIGTFTAKDDRSYAGSLRTLTINQRVTIVPNGKTKNSQPDYRVFAGAFEVGAAWVRNSERTGEEYLSVTIAAPEFGPRKLYANLVSVDAPGESDHTHILLWNAQD